MVEISQVFGQTSHRHTEVPGKTGVRWDRGNKKFMPTVRKITLQPIPPFSSFPNVRPMLVPPAVGPVGLYQPSETLRPADDLFRGNRLCTKSLS